MTATIILAAGASRRLGRAKQTLTYKDKPLLQHAITAALEADIGPVIVVTGANRIDIERQIENEPVTILHNNDYDQGIASSITRGVTHVQAVFEQCKNIILMVCDQPFVKKEILIVLVNTKASSGKPIVACAYNDTIGVPALFDQQFFSLLLELKGEEGGKKVILEHTTSVATIPFPAGSIDIDTAADYDALLAQNIPAG